MAKESMYACAQLEHTMISWQHQRYTSFENFKTSIISVFKTMTKHKTHTITTSLFAAIKSKSGVQPNLQTASNYPPRLPPQSSNHYLHTPPRVLKQNNTPQFNCSFHSCFDKPSSHTDSKCHEYRNPNGPCNSAQDDG